MPQAKKQKTVHDSGVFLEESGSESSDSAFETVRIHKNDKEEGAKSKNNSTDETQSSKPANPAPYDYVCIPHPFFDVEDRNWLNWTLDPDAYIEDELEVFEKLYKPWLKVDLLGRKAKYCDPGGFGMELYQDWQGWGVQEILENMVCAKIDGVC